jgi:hypothetical protein
MTSPSLLVLGVCLAKKENHFDRLSLEVDHASLYKVNQKWAAIGAAEPAPGKRGLIAFATLEPLPKFRLINTLLAGAAAGEAEYVLVVDDDIELPENFLDDYLGYVRQYDLALAQPARTLDSFIDHPFVGQMPGLTARRTRFVEIGPLFSIRRDLFDTLLPFDETSPMGWGYDLAWPVMVERRNLKMGIVDATPVTHNLRQPVSHYNFGEAQTAMDGYLSRNPHLSFEEAFTIIESYS